MPSLPVAAALAASQPRSFPKRTSPRGGRQPSAQRDEFVGSATEVLPMASRRLSNGLVNLSMTLQNVDLPTLESQPILRACLETAVKAAIAEVGGHNLTREDVHLELSTSARSPGGPPSEGGGLVLFAMVRPPEAASAYGVDGALRSGQLGKVLAQKMTVGPVTVGKVAVLEEEWATLPHWLVLLALALLGAILLVALGAVLVQRRARGRWKTAPKEGRELISCQEPLDELPGSGKGALRLRFLDLDGDERLLLFACRPVGISFAEREPTRVAGFPVGSQARKKGVKAGWVLTHVADEQLPRHLGREEVLQCLEEHSRELEPWPLRMDFEAGDGVVRTLYFTEGPLGIAFESSLPVVVGGFKPGGTAKLQGVEKGWALTRVGDVDLREETDLHKVMSYVIDGASQLSRRLKERRGPLKEYTSVYL